MSRGIDAQNPWPGLSAFDESSARFFQGREAESADLARLVGQAPLTVLFAKSGLGKTSLLQAGLFPRLRLQNVLPVYVRLDVRERERPLAAQAASALAAEIDAQGVDATPGQAGESLWEHLHRAEAEWWSRKNHRLTPLFVFDQFEEVFTLGAANPDGIERLRLDLSDLIENRLPAALVERIEAGAEVEHLDLRGQRYKVLLSFREDFLPEVEGWKIDIPSLMRNRLRLLPMNAERALQVVSGAGAHELVSEEVGREIVSFVAAAQAGGVKEAWEKLEIEPALLSMVCEGLNETRKARGSPQIDAALLMETGHAIIGDFYARCIAGVPERTRRFIEDELITEGGFRNSYPVADALERGALTAPLLGELVNRRLLRIDHQFGAERVELIHDRLTGVVREHRDRERERQRTARQRRLWWAVGSAVAGLALIAVLLFGLWRNANRQRDVAVQQGRVALSRQLAAEAGRAVLTSQLDRALLLAVAANLEDATVEARRVVLEGLQRDPRLDTYLWQRSSTKGILAFSAEGRLLASAGLDATVEVWDLSTRKALGEPVRTGESSITALAFSPEGTWLAIAQDNGDVLLWPLGTAKPALELLGRYQGRANSLAFRPGGSVLVAAGDDGGVRLWNVAERRPAGAPIAGGNPLSGAVAALSRDGGLLAWLDSRGRLSLWETDSGRRVGELAAEGHRPALGMAFSPDGKLLASGSADGSVSLWNVATRRPMGEPLRGHRGYVWSLAFSADGRWLATGSKDDTAIIWDVAARKQVGKPLSSGVGVGSVAFGSGQMLASAGQYDGVRYYNAVSLWDLRERPPLGRVTPAHKSEVRGLAFSSDGRVLASAPAAQDESVLLWDLAGSRPAAEPLPGAHGFGGVIALSPDGRTLATLGKYSNIDLWDVAGRKRMNELRPAAGATTFAFSPAGRMLAVGSPAGEIQLLELDGRTASVPAHKRRVTGLAFNGNGRLLATGSEDGAVTFRDPPQRVDAGVLRGSGSPIVAVAASPDGRLIASAAEDQNITLWDVAAQRAAGPPLRVPGAPIVSLAFNHDGRLLAAATAYRGVALWDVETRRAVGRFLQHPEAVEEFAGDPLQGARQAQPNSAYSVAFLPPDGRLLASGGDDGTVTFWSLDRESWLRAACGLANRNLSPTEWGESYGERPYEKTCSQLPVHPDWTAEAVRLATEGKTAEGQARFRKLQELEPDWKLDPQVEAEAVASAGKAAELYRGDPKPLLESNAVLSQFREAYAGAARSQRALQALRRQIPGRNWNVLCWEGALRGIVIAFACDEAVLMEPVNGGSRDSRGASRALVGDYRGAIEDFSAFLTWLERTGQVKEWEAIRAQRVRWIEALRQGRNPLTPEELKSQPVQ